MRLHGSLRPLLAEALIGGAQKRSLAGDPTRLFSAIEQIPLFRVTYSFAGKPLRGGLNADPFRGFHNFSTFRN